MRDIAEKILDRLIDFAVRIIRLSDALPKTAAGRHVSGQLLRSGTSPAPNYGEACSAESRADFLHKMGIVHKELNETLVWLKLIYRAKLVNPSAVEPLMEECLQLIRVFTSSIKTAKAQSNGGHVRKSSNRNELDDIVASRPVDRVAGPQM